MDRLQPVRVHRDIPPPVQYTGDEATNEITVDRDIVVLANPQIAGLPNWIVGLVAASGLAAARSTAAGLLVVIWSSAARPRRNPRACASVVPHMTASETTSERRDLAFREHVLPELGLLHAMAMRLTGNPHEAEDLVQDTLLRAYRALHRFDGRYPRSWLLTILRNTNINRARKKRPMLVHDEQATFGRLAGHGSAAREGAVEDALDRIPDGAVLGALHDLSVDHRDVILLVDVDGLAYREAADLLGIPVGTVMSRLHRARAAMRSGLEERGHLRGGTP